MPDLKRGPLPHDSAHPMADLLRMKSFRASREIAGTEPLDEELMAPLAAGLPVLALLAPVL